MKTMTNKEPLKLFKALAILMLAILLFPKIAFSEDIKQAEKPQERQTIRELIFAAEKGDAQAQIKLGLRYEEGNGVDRNEKEALKWIQRAAEKNLPAAQNMVALYYANGKGVAVNNEEAVKWFRLAAAQNFAESQYFVGLYYANGIGVTKDEKEGARFYRLAAEQGHDRAAYALGQCYSVGDGVPKDDIEAITWISLAAVFGDERGVSGLRTLKKGKSSEQLAEADKRVKEFINTRSPKELATMSSQSVVNKGDKSNTETTPANTSIKAFDNLFFGEERSAVVKKQKKRVMVGEMEFELICHYERIAGMDVLSHVNLKAIWTDVEEEVVKSNLKEIEQILSVKFGKPRWKIKDYKDDNSDEEGTYQCQWEIAEEKQVNVWMRERPYKTEHKEKDKSLSGKFFGKEVTVDDYHREYTIVIGITSKTVYKKKAKEAETKVKESAAPF